MKSRRHFVGRGVKVPMSACLDCGKELNGATAVDHRDPPSPGAITICIYCGHIMALGDDLHLRQLTDEEMIGVAGDPRIVAVQRARRDAALIQVKEGRDGQLKNLTNKKGGRS